MILVAEFLAPRYKTLVQLANVSTQLEKFLILGTKFSALWDKILSALTKNSTMLNSVLLSLSELLTFWNNTSMQLTKLLTSWDKIVITATIFSSNMWQNCTSLREYFNTARQTFDSCHKLSEMSDKIVIPLTNFSTPWYNFIIHPSKFLTLWDFILKKLTKVLSFSDKNVTLDSTFL